MIVSLVYVSLQLWRFLERSGTLWATHCASLFDSFDQRLQEGFNSLHSNNYWCLWSWNFELNIRNFYSICMTDTAKPIVASPTELLQASKYNTFHDGCETDKQFVQDVKALGRLCRNRRNLLGKPILLWRQDSRTNSSPMWGDSHKCGAPSWCRPSEQLLPKTIQSKFWVMVGDTTAG